MMNKVACFYITGHINFISHYP